MNKLASIGSATKWSAYDKMNNVLNGIAYNPKNKHFYLTGKEWYYIYEVVFK